MIKVLIGDLINGLICNQSAASYRWGANSSWWLDWQCLRLFVTRRNAFQLLSAYSLGASRAQWWLRSSVAVLYWTCNWLVVDLCEDFSNFFDSKCLPSFTLPKTGLGNLHKSVVFPGINVGDWCCTLQRLAGLDGDLNAFFRKVLKRRLRFDLLVTVLERKCLNQGKRRLDRLLDWSLDRFSYYYCWFKVDHEVCLKRLKLNSIHTLVRNFDWSMSIFCFGSYRVHHINWRHHLARWQHILLGR